MTIQQALEIINVNGYGYSEDEALEAHNIINREMGYRIKKHPTRGRVHASSMFPEAQCPECGTIVYGTEYACSYCGQRLDWEAENENG